MVQKLVLFTESLLGFDAFCMGKKFLVFNLVDRNLKVKYRRSFLGFFWTIVSPVAMSLIFYFVFNVVLKVNREHYLPFILCGVLPWSFFAQSLGESTESIVANQGLITKIPIPIHVFPYVVSLTNFSTLAFSIPVILALSLYSGVSLTWGTLWLFYFLGCLLLLSYSIGTVLSISYVYLRDLKHAINLILQIWFYATPIVYDESMIPEKYKLVLYMNPVGPIFAGIHESLLGYDGNLELNALVSFGWCVFILLVLRLTYTNLRSGLVERL